MLAVQVFITAVTVDRAVLPEGIKTGSTLSKYDINLLKTSMQMIPQGED